MPKNIVICCDGTGNQITTDATNVMRLWSAMVHDAGQVGFYDPGVGTLGDPRVLGMWRRQLRKRLDGAIGYSIRENFIEAYSFLAEQYQPEDRIYVFGFSRGAYTARALAGAIHRFGLAHPQHQNLAPYVWRTFSNDDGDEDSKTLFSTANRFQRRFARKVPIRFVGVWDTVSSFGLITSLRTLPDTRANPSVQVMRHAVSIDERRACFRANHCASAVEGRDTKEIWFAGVHSDVGGGYPENEAGLAKLSLRWMLGEAMEHGLRLDPARCREVLDDPGPDPLADRHESLKGWWHVLQYCPQRRWRHSAKRVAWSWNPWERRSMVSEEVPVPRVHESVRLRMDKSSYRPRNFPKTVQWESNGPDPCGPQHPDAEGPHP